MTGDRPAFGISAGSHVVRLAPPLVISEAEIDHGTRVLGEVLERILV